jgi:hypothetical protein
MRFKNFYDRYKENCGCGICTCGRYENVINFNLIDPNELIDEYVELISRVRYEGEVRRLLTQFYSDLYVNTLKLVCLEQIEFYAESLSNLD